MTTPTRIVCPAVVSRDTDKQHMVNVENGKTLFHNLVPGLAPECPGSRQEIDNE